MVREALGEPIVGAHKVIGEVVGKLAACAYEVTIAREVAREVAGEPVVGVHEATVAPAMASPKVGHLAMLLLVTTMDSNSRLHNSPPRTSQVPDHYLGG